VVHEPEFYMLTPGPATLLNHDHTVFKTNEYFQDSIQTLKKNKNITFILSEVGSSIGNRNDKRGPDLHLSGSLGSSVWTVDWMLYTMTIVRLRPTPYLLTTLG
jgi:hypothetical protein